MNYITRIIVLVCLFLAGDRCSAGVPYLATQSGNATNSLLISPITSAAYTTNSTNFMRVGSQNAREAFWTFNGPTGFTWIIPTYTPSAVAALIDIRYDPDPNKVIYVGDVNTWEGMSMQMKGGGATGTDPTYTSNRFTISFSDLWGFRFNQLEMNTGSESSFGADPPKQITFIRHDDHRHFFFGPTNGYTTIQGTNIQFAVTNGLAGGSAAIVTAGLVTKDKGWTFYGNMTNSGGEFFLDNNKGIWSAGTDGGRYKAIYTDTVDPGDLNFSANGNGIVFRDGVVANSSVDAASFVRTATEFRTGVNNGITTNYTIVAGRVLVIKGGIITGIQ